MAIALAQECPHCLTQNTGFTALHAEQYKEGSRTVRMLMACNRCNGPIAVLAEMREPMTNQELARHYGGLHEIAQAWKSWPQPEGLSIPLHLPVEVAKAFRQAEAVIRVEDAADAVVGMDRKALDLATKLIATAHPGQGLDIDNLAERIKRMAAANLLTTSLADWAHQLRTIGNVAMHDLVGVTAEEAKDTHELTRYVLTYLFTLPEQVAAARAHRTAASPAPSAKRSPPPAAPTP